MLGLLFTHAACRTPEGDMRSNFAFVRNLAVLAVFAVSAHIASAQVSQETREDASRLVGSVYAGPSMTTLRELSDGFGGRLSGSPAYNRAAEWAAGKFRSYGIQNVKLEP